MSTTGAPHWPQEHRLATLTWQPAEAPAGKPILTRAPAPRRSTNPMECTARMPARLARLIAPVELAGAPVAL
eukprot:7782112-Alexandrium_andersonii.AAC.1